MFPAFTNGIPPALQAELARVNAASNRLPNTLSISFFKVDSSALIEAVKDRLAVSAGAACHTGVVKMSGVLTAMGLDPEWGGGTVRLSVGIYTTVEEVETASDVLVAQLAMMIL
jgi:cysteine sulfinate desulfinase/cysteine desulfurase-like protein